MRKTELAPLSAELHSLLERERALPAQPPDVRERAVLRARAALRATSIIAPVRAPLARARWLIAAAVVLLAANLLGAALRAKRHAAQSALGGAPRLAGESPLKKRAPAMGVAGQLPSERADDTARERSELGARAAALSEPERAALPAPKPQASAPHPVTAVEAYALELKWLGPARPAVARGDYAAALAAIGAHARRFPAGRLAEEREALRVQALVGLGRANEAQRAAHAFQARFPASILLSRMKEPVSVP